MNARLDAVLHEAGVTRLAELTGLDRVGVPVWQAVRPWSRALTVHQGKGLDDHTARRGAAMEALESHHAEQWRPAVPELVACWDELPPDVRAPDVNDFAVRRGDVDPTVMLGWVAANPLGRCATFLVPTDCVSLDCTTVSHPGLARDSNGQAAHFDLNAALTTGMLELIERDAVAAWLAGSVASRGGSEIDPATFEDVDVKALWRRLARCDISLRIYQLRTVVPVTVMVAETADHHGGHTPYSHVWGSAAAFDPAAAVLAAILETLQTRCSQIAGSRDTIPLTAHDKVPGRLTLPPRPGWQGHAFQASDTRVRDLPMLVAALIDAGYSLVGYVLLSPPRAAAVTIKAFVPGLGFEKRRRRAP